MRLASLKLVGAVVAVATAGACSATPGAEHDIAGAAQTQAPDLRPDLAQVNDVSLLLPLARSRAAFDRGYLAPASPGRGGALLGEAIYARAFGAPGTLQIGGTPAAPSLAGLKLVAVRFDPCFAETRALREIDEAACKNQMRLVFQTLTFDGNRAKAADDAVHAFYALTRDELARAVQTMIELRVRIAGDRRLGALAPHPLLTTTSGDLDLGVVEEVNRLVASLAGPSNLVQLTQFAPSGLDTTWNFSGFDVAADTPLVIPTLPAGDDTHVAFFAGFTPGELDGDPAFVPASRAPAADNMQSLGNRMTARAAGQAGRRASFAAMLRIEDPGVHTPNTIDCASCHAVDPVRQLVGARHFAEEMSVVPGAFQPDPRWVPDADVAQLPRPDAGVNVHMFSYKGTTPSIHRRTIHESAAVVAHVNARVLPRER